VAWDTSKPDGMMFKRMDVSNLAFMGWQARIAFRDGLEQTFRTRNHQSLIRQCGLDRDLTVTAGDPQIPPAGRAECE
jgi:hypothetical protein